MAQTNLRYNRLLPLIILFYVGVVLAVAPAFISEPDTFVDFGDSYRYAVIAEDLDGDVLTVSAKSSLPDWLTLTPLDGKVNTYAGIAGVSGFVDGDTSQAQFGLITDGAYNSQGKIFLVDKGNHSIRVIWEDSVRTFAGVSGNAGYADGEGNAAQFSTPYGITIDTEDMLYVSDGFNNAIRKISSTGIVSKLSGDELNSGYVEGSAEEARFNSPTGIVIDKAGNLYVADSKNHVIRKVAPDGSTSLFAGTPQASGYETGAKNVALFNQPMGMTIDNDGNIYVADYNNHAVRKVSPTGEVTNFAGTGGSFGVVDGIGTAARFYFPEGITVDKFGSIYVSDKKNHIIRRISTKTAQVTTIAGVIGGNQTLDGPLETAKFNHPVGLISSADGELLVTETGVIRRVQFAIAELTGTPAESDGGQESISLELNENGTPSTVLKDFTLQVGELPVAPTSNDVTITISEDFTYSFYGGVIPFTDENTNDTLSAVKVRSLPDAGLLFYDANSNSTYDMGEEVSVDAVVQVENVNRLLFKPAEDEYGLGYTSFEFQVSDGTFYSSANNTITFNVTAVNDSVVILGTPDGSVSSSDMYTYWLNLDGVDAGEEVVFSSLSTLPEWARLVQPGEIQAIAGVLGQQGYRDGAGLQALFYTPCGIAMHPSGVIYIADSYNHIIRKIDRFGEVSTFAGTEGDAGFLDGWGSEARFNTPMGLSVDAAGNVYVADYMNHAVRMITPAGLVTTLSAAGSEEPYTEFGFPCGIAVDHTGNIYVSDGGKHTVSKITPSEEGEFEQIEVVAGQPGIAGSEDGSAEEATFDQPMGIVVDSTGTIYVSDNGNNTIREIAPDGTVETIAGIVDSAGSEDGPGEEATFDGPMGIALDSSGNLIITEESNVIRQIDSFGNVTTITPIDETGAPATIGDPAGIVVGPCGFIFIVDKDGCMIYHMAPDYGVVGTPTHADSGSYEIIIEIGDGEFVDSKEIPIVVEPVNAVPVARDTTIVIPENSVHDFAVADFGFTDYNVEDQLEKIRIQGIQGEGQFYLDLNGDKLFNEGEAVSGGDSIANTQLPLLHFVPEQDSNGASYATLDFQVNDGENYSVASYTITIDVTPVNTAPIIECNLDTFIIEDSSFTFDKSMCTVTDPDNSFEEFILTIIESTSCPYAGLVITPLLNDTSEITVWLEISDGELFDTTTVVIPILPVNDAPDIISIDTIIVEAGDTIVINEEVVTVEDPENDSLIFIPIDGEEWDVIDSIIVISGEFEGEIEIPVVVSDGEDESDTVVIPITVEPANEAPELVEVVPGVIIKDSSKTITIKDVVAVDPEDDSLEVIVLPGDNYTVEDSVTIVPDKGYEGEIEVPIVVTDGDKTSDTVQKVIEVRPENSVPILVDGTLPPIEKNDFLTLLTGGIADPVENFNGDGKGKGSDAGDNYEHVLDIQDADGDDVQIIIYPGENYSVSGTTIIPDEDFIGDLYIPVAITDGANTSEIKILELGVYRKIIDHRHGQVLIDKGEPGATVVKSRADDLRIEIPADGNDRMEVRIFDPVGNRIASGDAILDVNGNFVYNLELRGENANLAGSFVGYLLFYKEGELTKMQKHMIGIQR